MAHREVHGEIDEAARVGSEAEGTAGAQDELIRLYKPDQMKTSLKHFCVCLMKEYHGAINAMNPIASK